MGISRVKISRASKMSAIGNCPGSYAAMLDAVPAAVLDALSSRQIATLVDAVWRACEQSKSIAIAAAVDEGAVWDARSQKFREIA